MISLRGLRGFLAGMDYVVTDLEPSNRKYDWAQRHKDGTVLLDITDTTQFLPAPQPIHGNIAVPFTTFADLKSGAYANVMAVSYDGEMPAFTGHKLTFMDCTGKTMQARDSCLA